MPGEAGGLCVSRHGTRPNLHATIPDEEFAAQVLFRGGIDLLPGLSDVAIRFYLTRNRASDLPLS
jgi:hypothetical protein